MKKWLQLFFWFCLIMLVLILERVLGFPLITLMLISVTYTSLDGWPEMIFLFLSGFILAVAFSLPAAAILICLVLMSACLKWWGVAHRYPLAVRLLLIALMESVILFSTIIPTHPLQIGTMTLLFGISALVGKWWLYRPQHVHVFGRARKSASLHNL